MRGSFASSTVCSLYLGWKWGRGSFASSTVCSLYLEWKWGRGSFASSPLPSLGGGGGGVPLHQPQCAPSTLPWVEVREGLIYIIQSVSLYLGWRWGRGSFVSSTVCSLYLGCSVKSGAVHWSIYAKVLCVYVHWDFPTLPCTC